MRAYPYENRESLRRGVAAVPKKVAWKPATLLYPVPVVLVTCQKPGAPANIMTVAWAGTVCSHPPMVSISIRPERYSHEIIKETGEFVVNLPTGHLAQAVDFCGVKSGRDMDKFAKTGLTPMAASAVNVPVVAECPVNLECQVRQVTSLGSHDMFIGEIVAIDVDEDLIDSTGKLRLGDAGLLTWVHGQYWSLERSLGKFGFSVQKRGPSQAPARRPPAGRGRQRRPSPRPRPIK